MNPEFDTLPTSWIIFILLSICLNLGITCFTRIFSGVKRMKIAGANVLFSIALFAAGIVCTQFTNSSPFFGVGVALVTATSGIYSFTQMMTTQLPKDEYEYHAETPTSEACPVSIFPGKEPD